MTLNDEEVQLVLEHHRRKEEIAALHAKRATCKYDWWYRGEDRGDSHYECAKCEDTKRRLKEPWQSYPEIWADEKAFMNYLRGAFRSVWSRYPAKLEWKKRQMLPPPPGYTGRAKSVGYCAFCGKMGSASSFEVDHIDQAGSFKNKQEAIAWFWRLLDTNDNWQLACKPCHKIKSYAEREGLTFSEAKVAKEVIRLLRKENKKDMLALLQQHGVECKNADQRREALTKILKEGGYEVRKGVTEVLVHDFKVRSGEWHKTTQKEHTRYISLAFMTN